MFGPIRLIFILAILYGVSAKAIREAQKIVGGVPINITDAPYQVVVQLGGAMICGGVIISDSFIATAAHCIIRTTSYYTVRSGTTEHDFGGTMHKAINITVHPYYDDVLYDYDLAIIEIDPPLIFDDHHQPIDIIDEIMDEGFVTISGWGTSSINGSTSRFLQSVTVPVVPWVECNKLYAEFGGISSRMFCAGSAGHDSCLGDSGGPVVSNGHLVATVSWANECALPGYPGVNANIADSEMRYFIRQATGV